VRTPRPARWAQMSHQQAAGQAAATLGRIDGDGQYFSLISSHARHGKADHLAPLSQPMNQRIALAQHRFEFAFTPAAVKRCAVQLRQRPASRRRAGSTIGGAAAPPIGEP